MDSVDNSINMDVQSLDQPIEQEPSYDATSNIDKGKEPPPKRARACTSEVWKSFTKIGLVDGTPKSQMQQMWQRIFLWGYKIWYFNPYSSY